MKKVFAFAVLVGLLFVRPAWATDSFNSEASHAVGGALLGAVGTAAGDYVAPQQRALIGFASSMAVGVGIEIYRNRQDNAQFSWLDLGAHAVGSLIGVYFTDQYFLAPVIGPDGKRLGFAANFRF